MENEESNTIATDIIDFEQQTRKVTFFMSYLLNLLATVDVEPVLTKHYCRKHLGGNAAAFFKVKMKQLLRYRSSHALGR
jgi:hypothetical protein